MDNIETILDKANVGWEEILESCLDNELELTIQALSNEGLFDKNLNSSEIFAIKKYVIENVNKVIRECKK